MKIDYYDPSKTAEKTILPLSIIIIVNIVLCYLKHYNISIDDATVWEIALAGYGAMMTFKNWIKNHKRGKAASG